MYSKYVLQLAAIAIIPFLASCSQGVDLLSKNEIQVNKAKVSKTKKQSTTKREKPIVATPSAELLSSAAGKPKDKHSMPIYKFAERQRIVRTTAYTCSEADHLAYGSKNAIGTKLQYSDKVRSAAADWSFYPVGTVFRIKGMKQLFVIDDYGSALTGTGTIDLYKPTKGMMNHWGLRNVEIAVVQWGSFTRSAKILKGRTAYRHCREMLANIQRQQGEGGAVVKN